MQILKNWDNNKYLIMNFYWDMTNFSLVYWAIKHCQLLNLSISYDKDNTKDLFMDKKVSKTPKHSKKEYENYENYKP